MGWRTHRLNLTSGVIFLVLLLGQGCTAKLSYSPLLQAINGPWVLLPEDTINANVAADRSATVINSKLDELRNLVVTIDTSRQFILLKGQNAEEEYREFVITEQKPEQWELRVRMQETPMTFTVEGDTLQWITPDLNLYFQRIKIIYQPF
jgi:hypothetical protein